jgi:hypothetical protein
LVTAILRRVGTVLVAAGLVDIAVVVYCLFNRVSYTSSLNIFAVIAGIFLLRGSLRAASIIRWLAVLGSAVLLALAIVLSFLQSLDLTLTQIRVAPVRSFVTISIWGVGLCLLLWVSRELGRQQVQAALTSAGIKRRDMRVPAAVGIGLVAVLGIFLVTFLRLGGSAEHAKFLAEQQVGAGYRFHVRSLNIVQDGQGKSVSGVVTAWNENEIREVPVRWEER